MNILNRKLMAAGLCGYRSPELEEGGDGGGEADGETQEELISRLTAENLSLSGERDGLKSNNSKLLDEKKQKQREAKDATEAARAAELKASQDANDSESVGKHWQARYDHDMKERDDKIAHRDGLLLGGAKEVAIVNAKSLFIGKSQAIMGLALSRMIETSYNDDGNVVKTYKDEEGNVIGTDSKLFESYLNNSDSFKPHLLGVDSSGGLGDNRKPGAGGSQSKVMKRSEFEQTGSAKQMEFIKSGGKITD